MKRIISSPNIVVRIFCVVFFNIITFFTTANSQNIIPYDKSELLFNQALKAIEERNFIIKAKDFFYPEGKCPNRTPSNGYVSMSGNLGVMNLPPDSPHAYNLKLLYAQDKASKIKKIKTNKKGDVEFCMDIRNDDALPIEVKRLITLYKNTNECFVKIIGEYSRLTVMDFTGEIFPLEY